jgi:glycogen debranching enzyme
MFEAPALSVTSDGVQARAYSRHAARLFFCLFNGDKEVDRILMEKGDDHIHRLALKGVTAGQAYGYRADGPFAPRDGHYFDLSKLLIDPTARAVDRHVAWSPGFSEYGTDTGAVAAKSIVEAPLPSSSRRRSGSPAFIYELNVRSFTKLHPDVPVHLRGTVGALATEPVLQHLKMLGCDTVELMPIAAWSDEPHLVRQGLSNAWGYNPVVFMAADPRLAPGGPAEIRNTFATLHSNGIKVVLDVVFNHTGEGHSGGGTYSLRGLDHKSYYRMHGGDLVNDTGTGNTLILDSEPGLSLALTTLRYWVSLGADGFRYDLAPVMGRTETGFDPNAPLLSAIQADPMLANLIHIAEPWDVGPGGYQLGNFPLPWHEWNDAYREDVRKFWRGDSHMAGAFATRMAGSSDFFQRPGRSPSSSINFVSAHDGFALADVVRFPKKHNDANGEQNRDGNDHEASWVSNEPELDVRALLATLFVSRGTPMLTAGDEFGRSQKGNNNAYAQDNETTWLDWHAVDRDLLAFTSAIARFRQSHAAYFADAFLDAASAGWFNAHGTEMTQSDWHQGSTSSLALVINARDAGRMALLFCRHGNLDAFILPEAQNGMVWTNQVIADGVGDKFCAFVELPE